MLVGCSPFRVGRNPAVSDEIYFQKVKHKAVRFLDKRKYDINFSASLQDLITKLLIKDRKNRLGHGSEDWKDVIKHPAFAKIDVEKLLKKEIKAPIKPEIRKIEDLIAEAKKGDNLQESFIRPKERALVKQNKNQFNKFGDLENF